MSWEELTPGLAAAIRAANTDARSMREEDAIDLIREQADAEIGALCRRLVKHSNNGDGADPLG